MKAILPEGNFPYTASGLIPFLLLSTSSGAVPICLGIRSLIPDEYGVMLPLVGTGLLLFGLFNTVFFQAIFFRKVEVTAELLRTSSPIPMINQKFKLDEVDDIRFVGVDPKMIPLLEVSCGGKWNLVLGNHDFAKRVFKPNKSMDLT